MTMAPKIAADARSPRRTPARMWKRNNPFTSDGYSKRHRPQPIIARTSPSQSMPAVPAGTRFGPYEILDSLGAGGMGEVYRARDSRLNRTVAIKVLPPSLAGDAERRLRFEREARTVAMLEHPHVCGIYDFGDLDGSPYLVMPLLDGETLAARLEKGALPLDLALRVAIDTADALQAAHRVGVVHRDLKPANVFLVRRSGSATPDARLLDFGLAKLRPSSG